MNELRDLYQEVILDHNRRPRNFGTLPAANRQAEGYNPLCGDKVTVFLQVEDGRIRDVAFQGAGCAISTASASLMTEALKGLTAEEAREVFRHFHDLVTTGAGEGSPELGKLAVFSGVCEFPMRVKCATLAWHTLLAALEGKDAPVSTE
ncbi:MAG TPA: SUF system NifU family Fe-S cluster assembly protein [Thermoanaerobaculia bacterium]|jgi:nitrogen fixation NifU-like protein|nr:SUF system NifU family Fe-S cluster assembly protein [Thermoanaerobaculia bacterium]